MLEVRAVLASSLENWIHRCAGGEKPVGYVVANYEKEWEMQFHVRRTLHLTTPPVHLVHNGSRAPGDSVLISGHFGHGGRDH
jgi:hypothetical protein